jgi:hypothetical protein
MHDDENPCWYCGGNYPWCKCVFDEDEEELDEDYEEEE